MKFSYQLMGISIAALLLTACTKSPLERNQAKDDFEYLNTPEFTQWQTSDDAVAQSYRQFIIPRGNFSGEVGGDLDIRPPLQVLELVPGMIVDEEPRAVTLWTARPEQSDQLWAILKSELNKHNATLVDHSDRDLIGKNVTWVIGNEEGQAIADYQFTRINFGRRSGVRIEITQLTNDLNLPSQDFLLDRYAAAMANLLTTNYDAQLRAETKRQALRLGQNIVFTMGTDRNALPIIVARTPFDIAWHRVPTMIEQFGFTVTGKSQSQGELTVFYRPADQEVWDSHKIEPLTIDRGKYHLLFGDLGNRTSINITDTDGKLLTEEQLSEFIPMLSATSNSTN
ncbi:outer membrane protein assembly factor BamC [Vibrio sp. RC27]